MVAASSSLRSGMTSRRRSSRPWWAKRKPPAVKKELPPRSCSGAFSRTSTEAPPSRAASAAQRAALPQPMTMMSGFMSSSAPAQGNEDDEAKGDPVPAEADEVVRLHEAEQPADGDEGGEGGHDRSQQHEPPAGRHRVGMPQRMQRLVAARGEQGGNAQQEGELGGRGPREPQGERDQDGRARARGAGEDGGHDL